MSQAPSTRYLGEEKISRLLLKFSIPCVMGLLISALYNIVDQIFIGNSELGYLGNAATGVSFPIICIANAFAWCVGDGAASYLSILAGRKDHESAHKCVGTGITVTLLISVMLTVLCEIFNEPLMRLFGASDQTVGMAVEYFAIVAGFFPMYLLLNVMNSMIRADGSPTYAMIAMLVYEKDIPYTIAHMVRFNCKTYPAPSPVEYFTRHPFSYTKPQLDHAIHMIQQKEAYKDI